MAQLQATAPLTLWGTHKTTSLQGSRQPVSPPTHGAHTWPTMSPEFYCRAWSGFSRRWVAYVDCDRDYPDKFELLGPVSINGKAYRCTGVLISVMNHRTNQQLFKNERIGLEVEALSRVGT